MNTTCGGHPLKTLKRRINKEIRVASSEFIPVSQVTHDMFDFCNALPVFRIVLLPIPKRIKVKILPVKIDSLFNDQFINVIHQPAPCFRITQI